MSQTRSTSSPGLSCGRRPQAKNSTLSAAKAVSAWMLWKSFTLVDRKRRSALLENRKKTGVGRMILIGAFPCRNDDQNGVGLGAYVESSHTVAIVPVTIAKKTASAAAMYMYRR